mmetsp:Transcript_2996/g.6228  ORF Transcript_2996/g.6228 Transcript_2996/m.6228 type:complete len:100 (+) Transcript_2996:425-724(+)
MYGIVQVDKIVDSIDSIPKVITAPYKQRNGVTFQEGTKKKHKAGTVRAQLYPFRPLLMTSVAVPNNSHEPNDPSSDPHKAPAARILLETAIPTNITIPE